MDHTGCMNGQIKTSELILPAFRVLFPMSITIVQSMWLITARQRSCGKVMFLLVSVCPQGVSISGPMSFPGGWVSLVPGPLQGGGVDMSRGWVCPEDGCVCAGGGYPLLPPCHWHLVAATCAVYTWAVRILLECFLVLIMQPHSMF